MLERTTMPPANPGLPAGKRQRPKPAPKGLRTRTPLGIFQYLVMCAIRALDNRAYVIEIQDHFVHDIKLAVDTAQIYVTAKQLAKLGLLDTEMIRLPEDDRRPVKMYTITKRGDAAIAATEQLLAAALNSSGVENSNDGRKKTTPPVAKSRVRPRTPTHQT